MLEKYKKKRDFTRTPEPPPSSSPVSWGSLTFVVQKHDARRLHYDFRLELDGVLKSWAVPRGPSTDPKEKRLAVYVEDHPLAYANFEGVIAEGNYGAGEVIVWDAGVYSPDEGGELSFGDRTESERRMREGLEAGKLSFTLHGHKLKGSWTLVRTARSPSDWLLIKHKDEHVDTEHDLLADDRSVESGLTLVQLKGGRMPVRAARADVTRAPPRDTEPALGRKAPFPTRLKPMLAHMVDKEFSHPDWIFEPKLDGFRALAFIRRGLVTIRSRNNVDYTTTFKDIARELSLLPREEIVLDGEVVAVNEQGLPDFELLQQSVGMVPRCSQAAAEILYYPFDILHLDGMDLQKVPLMERKKLLAKVLIPGKHIRNVEWVEGEGEAFFQGAMATGLEGMVAKRRESQYESGARTHSWLKVKGIKSQEFVVGGYTKGTGFREATFGALLLGYYHGNTLCFAGKVGSGFNDRSLASLQSLMGPLETDKSPFADHISREDVSEPVQWLKPSLVARTKFSNWTREPARLRAPVFLGLRADIEPRMVMRERAEAPHLAEAAAGASRKDASTRKAIAQVDAQLSGKEDSIILEVLDHKLPLSHLNKDLWLATPDREPITKRDVIRYYARMSPVLLPHLRDRPLTLTRYPDGINGEMFYQKHWEHQLPEFVENVRLWSPHNVGDGDYIMVNNLAALLWLGQIADLELHPWLSRVVREPEATHATLKFAESEENIDSSVLSYPDFIVFDMDPYIYSGKEKKGAEPELNKRAFDKNVEIALTLKEVLDQLSLSSFLKTSGKTGIHVYVPILRQYEYSVTRKTCETIGRFLIQQRPDDITMEWAVAKRPGKIFLDHNQNVRGKNMASVYSLRPLPGAPVSTPLRWDELKHIYPSQFTIDNVPERVNTVGDLWGDILSAKHDLGRLLGTIGATPELEKGTAKSRPRSPALANRPR